jgi:hypothetical protein
MLIKTRLAFGAAPKANNGFLTRHDITHAVKGKRFL